MIESLFSPTVDNEHIVINRSTPEVELYWLIKKLLPFKVH